MPVGSTFGVQLAADLPCGTSAAADEKPAVGCADADNKNPDLQDVSTGATGLEPATSGVTGRSCCFWAALEWAGIPDVSRSSRPLSCGDCRCGRRFRGPSAGSVGGM